ncbi:MAG: trypsin-like peptidase domain-containing protein [Bacteroidota bacterium]
MKNLLRFVIIFLLTTLAFFAGTSWKINQESNTQKEVVPTESPTKFTEEIVAPVRATEPAMGLNNSEKNTIALFERATPSVVFITTSEIRTNYYTRVQKEYQSGSGSGFIWDESGHIITNFHVIQGADRARVTLSDQTSYRAKVVGYAKEKDLAVLKIDAPVEKLRPLRVGNSYNLKVGQNVYAIGNPFGLDQTLTTGIVSALGREINSVAGIPIRDVIQSDAAINPGNSGGPLLNSSGELIGVNTAIYSPSGASAGIGFSIPVDVVKWVVPDLIKYGKMQRPTLGIELAAQRITEQLGVKGVLVLNVFERSAADRAGIQPTYRDANGRLQLGDIIVAVNDDAVENQNDLIFALENYRAGEEVTILVERDEQRVRLPLVLDPSR